MNSALIFFTFCVSFFFLAASVNSSCHNFSSKYFCSFELSCGCFVLSNAMWVVLGARSCHWVVFEKSAVLQLNEVFWVTGLSQAGGGLAPLVFCRSVNPISTTGAHYPHPVLQAPRIFRPCDGPELRNGFLRKSLLEQKTSLMMQMK